MSSSPLPRPARVRRILRPPSSSVEQLSSRRTPLQYRSSLSSAGFGPERGEHAIHRGLRHACMFLTDRSCEATSPGIGSKRRRVGPNGREPTPQRGAGRRALLAGMHNILSDNAPRKLFPRNAYRQAHPTVKNKISRPLSTLGHTCGIRLPDKPMSYKPAAGCLYDRINCIDAH